MAFRTGNRDQISCLPACVDDYVGEDDPVRIYDAFIDTFGAQELEKMGISLDEHQVGNSCYDPVAMLKLLVYGYSYGIRSSRKLERAVHHNLSFIWLVGGLQPDFKTIATFRRHHKKALKEVLRLCAQMCIRLGVIAGNTLFVDGTKLRANASLEKTWSPQRIKNALNTIDARIEKLLKECDAVDAQENANQSLVQISQDIAKARGLRKQMEQVAAELKAENKRSLNTVDGDCAYTNSRHGFAAGYNAQIVVDDSGLIVNADVTNQANDQQQLSPQIRQAEETLGHSCCQAVADTGYSNMEQLHELESRGIEVIVPVKRNTRDRNEFSYDKATDSYKCPEGHCLAKRRKKRRGKCLEYGFLSSSVPCTTCRRWGRCTTSPSGRRLERSLYEETAEKVAKRFTNKDIKEVHIRRKYRAESPFSYIRGELGVRNFLLRGLEGVCAEWSLMATAYNIRRLIGLKGINWVKSALAG